MAVVPGPSFPDQGANLCLLHWQVDSSPLRHQEVSFFLFYNLFKAISFF